MFANCNSRRWIVSGCAGVGILWSAWAGADTLRCTGGLVRDGDLAAQVLRLCGEPWRREAVAAAQLRTILGGSQRRKGSAQMWTYNFGPTQFIRHLYFIDGRLQRIKTGPRGSRVTAPKKRR